MSSILGKIPKFTLKLPSALAKAGRTMSECPLELSFSLCDDGSCTKNRSEEEIPLQVKLPEELEKHENSQAENKETMEEKADEEKSEKQDNMEVTCSVSVDGQEKQEFSFTLYDFDTCDKVNKQDVEKVVVRSICEALGKTLKLPPSGSRTIKVKLAISPDSAKDIDTKEPIMTNDLNWPPTESLAATTSKMNDCCSAQSANTTSTYLPSSVSEKPPKFSSPIMTHRSPQVVRVCSPDVRSMPSPKLKPARHHRLLRHDLKSSLKERIAMQMNANDNRLDDIPQNLTTDEHIPHHKHTSRDHVPECRDRRNHYLDLAGVESPKHQNGEASHHPKHHGSEPVSNPYVQAYADPKYICPYRILDRTHVCSKSHRTRETTHHSSPLKKPCHPKVSPATAQSSPRMYRTSKANPEDDLLNLNFDLCDLVPEAKFDWEKQQLPHQHRRSKSYDLYESNPVPNNPVAGLYSPKLKPRMAANNQNWASILESQKLGSPGGHHMPSSPGHHYRHRHRDREHKRAMQQVASWIAREHSSNSKAEATKQFMCSSVAESPHGGAVSERHEHHHLHEHVHHHYHHFVEF